MTFDRPLLFIVGSVRLFGAQSRHNSIGLVVQYSYDTIENGIICVMCFIIYYQVGKSTVGRFAPAKKG